MIVDFPAGHGVVTISIPRIESIYSDYAYRGVKWYDIRDWARYWKNGYDARITKFERQGKNFLIEYDLSEAETMIFKIGYLISLISLISIILQLRKIL